MKRKIQINKLKNKTTYKIYSKWKGVGAMANNTKTIASQGIIEYKGYYGKVEFDNDAGIFHGSVINLRDVITFQGTCVEDLRQAMADSVDDYLEFCAELGRDPEKPFTGKFILRIAPELHREITIRAKAEDISLNQWVSNKLESSLA
jgi:predicted HicB family RNase H-like nuclease